MFRSFYYFSPKVQLILISYLNYSGKTPKKPLRFSTAIVQSFIFMDWLWVIIRLKGCKRLPVQAYKWVKNCEYYVLQNENIKNLKSSGLISRQKRVIFDGKHHL